MTAGLLVMGLLKTPLRWSGALFLILATVWAARIPSPDALVAGDGRTFAVRRGDGRLAFHHTGGDSFAVKEWLAADAHGRDVRDPSLGQGIACDAAGCIGRLADGARVAFVMAPDAYDEDCRRTLLVIASRAAPPPGCSATVIAREDWRQHGALSLRRTDAGFAIEPARSTDYDRPWSPAPIQRSARQSGVVGVGAPATRAAPRDATPRQDDIEADQ